MWVAFWSLDHTGAVRKFVICFNFIMRTRTILESKKTMTYFLNPSNMTSSCKAKAQAAHSYAEMICIPQAILALSQQIQVVLAFQKAILFLTKGKPLNLFQNENEWRNEEEDVVIFTSFPFQHLFNVPMHMPGRLRKHPYSQERCEDKYPVYIFWMDVEKRKSYQ